MLALAVGLVVVWSAPFVLKSIGLNVWSATRITVRVCRSLSWRRARIGTAIVPIRRAAAWNGAVRSLAWYVDISQAIDRLQHGISLEEPGVRTVLDGRQVAFFYGPDGERIELVQMPR